MRSITVPGLALYCLLSGLGLFIDQGLSNGWLLIPWIGGYLFLIFRVAYEAYVTPPPIRPFPFIVLGIILLNFLVQVSGGVHSLIWPAYFIFAVIVAAFSPPRRAYAMVGIILAIELANLYFSRQNMTGSWFVYAGFGLALAGVSAATSHILSHTRRQAAQFKDAHERLIAGADALDPLADPANLESLTAEHRQMVHVKTAQQREITFNGLLEMIYGFVPAHTYALFLREQRDSAEVFALRAVRTDSPDAVLPVGTILDPEKRMLIDTCAQQRQSQNITDLAAISTPLSTLGYYRADVRTLPVRSCLVLPIVLEDRAIAVLAVDSLEPGAFSLDTQDMLDRFAPFFIQIIEKIGTSLSLATTASHFGALHNISEELISSLKFDEIMERVIPLIRRVVSFDFCACVLAGEKEGRPTLTFAVLQGYDVDLLGQSFFQEESPVVGHMRKHWEEQLKARRDEQRVINYYTADLGDRGRDIGLFPYKELQRPIRSLYGRLLVTKDTFLGAFFLASLKPDAFSEYQREYLLDTLVNQFSQTSHNSLLYQRIESMARTDGLTGLLNHRTFMEKLREKYKELERAPRPFSILLMDIDKFKNVNDKYGHPVGDVAIKAVARVLSETVRASDFAARYGGEEFAVGMVDTDAKGAEQMAERVRKIMENTMITRVSDGELRVTLSIGVVTFPEDSEDLANLVTFADEALYHAKRSGRNRVCPYSEARKHQTASAS